MWVEDYHLTYEDHLSIEFGIESNEQMSAVMLSPEQWLQAAKQTGLIDDFDDNICKIHQETHEQGFGGIIEKEVSECLSADELYNRLTCGDIRRILEQSIINKSIKDYATEGISASD